MIQNSGNFYYSPYLEFVVFYRRDLKACDLLECSTNGAAEDEKSDHGGPG